MLATSAVARRGGPGADEGSGGPRGGQGDEQDGREAARRGAPPGDAGSLSKF